MREGGKGVLMGERWMVSGGVQGREFWAAAKGGGRAEGDSKGIRWRGSSVARRGAGRRPSRMVFKEGGGLVPQRWGCARASDRWGCGRDCGAGVGAGTARRGGTKRGTRYGGRELRVSWWGVTKPGPVV